MLYTFDDPQPPSAITKSIEGDTVVLTTVPHWKIDGRFDIKSYDGRPPSDLKFAQALHEAIITNAPVVLRSIETGVEVPVTTTMSIDDLSTSWARALQKKTEEARATTTQR